MVFTHQLKNKYSGAYFVFINNKLQAISNTRL